MGVSCMSKRYLKHGKFANFEDDISSERSDIESYYDDESDYEGCDSENNVTIMTDVDEIDYILGELWDAGCPIYDEDFT